MIVPVLICMSNNVEWGFGIVFDFMLYVYPGCLPLPYKTPSNKKSKYEKQADIQFAGK